MASPWAEAGMIGFWCWCMCCWWAAATDRNGSWVPSAKAEVTRLSDGSALLRTDPAKTGWIKVGWLVYVGANSEEKEKRQTERKEGKHKAKKERRIYRISTKANHICACILCVCACVCMCVHACMWQWDKEKGGERQAERGLLFFVCLLVFNAGCIWKMNVFYDICKCQSISQQTQQIPSTITIKRGIYYLLK